MTYNYQLVRRINKLSLSRPFVVWAKGVYEENGVSQDFFIPVSALESEESGENWLALDGVEVVIEAVIEAHIELMREAYDEPKVYKVYNSKTGQWVRCKPPKE